MLKIKLSFTPTESFNLCLSCQAPPTCVPSALTSGTTLQDLTSRIIRLPTPITQIWQLPPVAHTPLIPPLLFTPCYQTDLPESSNPVGQLALNNASLLTNHKKTQTIYLVRLQGSSPFYTPPPPISCTSITRQQSPNVHYLSVGAH